MDKKRYEIKTLLAINQSYDSEHRLIQDDVDMANGYVCQIENTRSDTIPKAGDRLRYTNEHGDYYGRAHIEYNRDGVCNICEQPYVPFIGKADDGILCNTSGGAWTNIPSAELKYIGKVKRVFHYWGHCGMRGNGAVCFVAEVSEWEYVHPEPLYGDFTTRLWQKFYVTKLDEESKADFGGNLYLAHSPMSSEGHDMAFRTQEEFDMFVKYYKAKIFPGNWTDRLVLWCYREDRTRIDESTYNELNLPQMTIYCNGKRQAKYAFNDEEKIISIFYTM